MKLTPPTENASEKEVRAHLRKLTTSVNPIIPEQASVTTTDATPTVIWDVELPANSVSFVKVDCVGVTADGTEAGGYGRWAVFRRPGTAAVQQVGATVLTFTREVTAGWDVGVAVSSTTGFIEVTVTGAAATSIEWRSLVTIQQS